MCPAKYEDLRTNLPERCCVHTTARLFLKTFRNSFQSKFS